MTVQVKLAELSAWDFQSGVLDRLTRAFFACQTEGELADLLLTAAAERTGARVSCLLLRDAAGDYRPVAAQGLEVAQLEQVCYRPQPSIFATLLQDAQPLAVTDAAHRPMFPETFRQARLDLLQSRYWVPLSWQGEMRAVLTLDREPGDETSRRFLTLLCERAAYGWERIESMFELLGLRRQVVRQDKTLRFQGRAMALTEDWNAVLNMLEDRFRQLEDLLATAVARLESSKGSIMLIDEATNELVVRAICGVEPEVAERIRNGERECLRLKMGEGVAGQVAQSGRPMVVHQVDQEPLFMEPQLSQVESILCVPLEVGGLTLGVLNFTNKVDGKRFTREDLRLATKLAQQAAQAINNARLYHLAVREPSTGLYNRVHLYHRLADEICRAKRYQRSFVLMSVGMDALPALRRRYGHAAINGLEQALAEVLEDTIRETDMVGRLGETALGVLLPETDANCARFLAERMLQECQRNPLLAEHGVQPLIGICSFPDRANTPQKLASRAELAMELAARTPERIQVYLAGVEAALQPALGTAG